jgi:3-phosphoshikimate 1-carboxyvinyltransferase
LIPLVASIGGQFILRGHGKLMERPNEALIDALSGHGVTVEQTDCVKVEGKLIGGEFRLRGDISSQYVSGLLMALPTLSGDSKIILTTPLASAPYVDITLEVLSAYGIKIDKTDYGFYVYGNQKFVGDICPEGDYSNSAFFLVYGAITGGVKVVGLNPKSVQGDRYILDILKMAGAKAIIHQDEILVKKDKLVAFTFDAENCPDLVPIASVLAACCVGRTTIKNIKRLKIKESDRIESVIAMLNAFKVNAFSDGDNLYIDGANIACGEVNSFNDHRIVMSGAILASVCDGQSIIKGAQAVNKSYPTFFNDFSKLGGIFYEI